MIVPETKLDILSKYRLLFVLNEVSQLPPGLIIPEYFSPEQVSPVRYSPSNLSLECNQNQRKYLTYYLCGLSVVGLSILLLCFLKRGMAIFAVL